MNKVIKSMVAIVLAVTMMFSGAVSAFAAGSDDAGIMETLSKVEEILRKYDVKGKLAEVKAELEDAAKAIEAKLETFSDENIQKVEKLLDEYCTGVNGAVDEAVVEVKEAINVFKATVNKPTEILEEVDEVVAKFEKLLNRVSAVKAAYTDIDGIIAGLETAIDNEDKEAAEEYMEQLKEANEALNDIEAILDDANAMKNDMDAIIEDVRACMSEISGAWDGVKSALDNLAKKMEKANPGFVAEVIKGLVAGVKNAGDAELKAALAEVEEYLNVKIPAVIAKIENVLPEEVKDKLLAALDKADYRSLAIAQAVAKVLDKLAGTDELSDGVKATITNILAWLDNNGYSKVLDAMEIHTPDTVEWLIAYGMWPRTQEGYVRLGDVDGDGDIDNIDAMFTMQYFVGLEPACEFNTKAADVDGNGEINNLDAMYILQKFVGNSTVF